MSARALVLLGVVGLSFHWACEFSGAAGAESGTAPLAAILDAVPPLAKPLGSRAPLFLWTPDLPAKASDAELESTLKALAERGLCLYVRWQPDKEKTRLELQRVAAIQKKLGMPLAVDANPISNGLFPKGPEGSHVDSEGKRFRGSGLGWDPGCPFGVQLVNETVRARFEAYAKVHAETGAALNYWISDWELDGPNEWKQSWTAARKCVTCRARIPGLETNFGGYQAAVRKVRSELQKENFVRPVLAQFPGVRIGNYAMNPTDGFRYYWDYYEEDSFGKPNLTEGIPYRREQGAVYRPWWLEEFEASGYTMSAPVLYAWYHLFLNYSFADTDYRWFYGMLLEGSSTARRTPAGTPIVAFIHWTPIGAPDKPVDRPAGFVGLSEAKYKELVWHFLLRGMDSFVLWAPGDEARELAPLHAVYAESFEWREFFEQGEPVLFELAAQPGPVVSALRLKNRLLVRRTDFGEAGGPVTITVDGKRIDVPAVGSRCQVLSLE